MAARRKCRHIKDDGDQCGATPLRKGTILTDSETGEEFTASGDGWCRAHDPKLPESVRFTGGAVPGAGRPRKPRADDLLLEAFSEHATQIQKVVADALVAKKAIVVGNGPHARVKMAPDHPTRLKAVEFMYDRILGKPRQAHQILGKDGEPAGVEVPLDLGRAVGVARVLQQAGAIETDLESLADGEDAPSNGNGNGHKAR